MSSRLEDVIQRGVAASRPSAATVPVGTLYYSTDTAVLERSTGSAWESYSSAAASGDVTGPGSALDQAIVLFNGATGKLIKDSGVLLSALATLPIAESDVTNLVTDLAAKAPLASPALTGVPTVPTASVGTNTTQAASTAFVIANAAAGSGDVVGPGSATNNALALFDGTTGKLLKDDPTVAQTITGVPWSFKGNDSSVLIQLLNAAGTLIGRFRQTDGPYGLEFSLDAASANKIVCNNRLLVGHTTNPDYEGVVCLNNTGAIIFSNDGGAALDGRIDAGLKRLAPNILRVSSRLNYLSTRGGGGLSLGDLASVSAKPAASAAVRGTLWITWGTAGVADVIEVCLKDAADAYAWHPITFT